jgi:hypothetical protein
MWLRFNSGEAMAVLPTSSLARMLSRGASPSGARGLAADIGYASAVFLMPVGLRDPDGFGGAGHRASRGGTKPASDGCPSRLWRPTQLT